MKKMFFLFLGMAILFGIVSCRKEKNTVAISKMIEIQENAINILNNQSVSGQSGETIINQCVQYLLTNPDVVYASVLEPDQIVVRNKSGVTSVILLIDDEENQEKNTYNTIRQLAKSEDTEVQITNHNVLIWEAWGDSYPVANDIHNIFNNCTAVDFNVDVIQNEDCTLQSLKNLTQYGFVYIKTHGGIFPNAQGEDVCWILTKERCNSSELSNEDVNSERKILITTVGVTKEYVNNQEIRRFSKKGHYWGVTNKFISKYVTGIFSSPSVVFVQACHSFDNRSLRDVFINDKKASVYLGYTHSVMAKFGHAKAIEFATNMLQQRLNALDAYSEIDVVVDNTRWLFAEWYWNAVFGDHTHYVAPRAMLMCSHQENPTYFGSKGYVECSALNKRWELSRTSYYPGIWGAVSIFSLEGDSIGIHFHLSNMANMQDGTYEPFFIHSEADLYNWEDNFYPMRFVVGPYLDSYVSWIDIYSDDLDLMMLNGQLIYQNQNNQKKYIFNFTAEDGHSFHGEYIE